MSSTSAAEAASEPLSRAALRSARRVCIKAGTSVVANKNGRPSLTRLGAITEQIAELNARGIEVLFVSSGAVGMGKRLLRKQRQMRMSFQDQILEQHGGGADAAADPAFIPPSPPQPRGSIKGALSPDSRSKSFASLLDFNHRPHTLAEKKKFYDSACAAAGQFEMMNFYSSLFDQCDVSASQILVTQADFTDATRLENLQYSIEWLLSLGIVPILNENVLALNKEGGAILVFFCHCNNHCLRRRKKMERFCSCHRR